MRSVGSRFYCEMGVVGLNFADKFSPTTTSELKRYDLMGFSAPEMPLGLGLV